MVAEDYVTEKAAESSDQLYNGFVEHLVDDQVIDQVYEGKDIYIDKEEAKIIWNEDAIKIIAKINGLCPNPGAWFLFQGERYKILKATLSDLNGEPGTVLDDDLTISCKNKSIKIKEIQRQGKNKQCSAAFLMGSKIKKGTVLS